MTDEHIVIKYQGDMGGCLRIVKDTDGNGILDIPQDSTFDSAPNEYNLFKKVDLGVDYKRGHRNVLLKSFNNETKFITGYEHKVNGEPILIDGKPTSYSHWQLHNYSDAIQEEYENPNNMGKTALYNPSWDRYFVITVNPNTLTLEFRLSKYLEDIKKNGAFAIELLHQ